MSSTAAPPRSSGVSRAFYMPLQRTARGRSGQQQWPTARLQSTTMGFFLLERFQFKNIATWVATYHYLPLLASILAIWVNCSLHLFFHFVFPLLREKYHWSMYTWRDVKEIPLAHDAIRALYVVLSHIGMLLGLAVLGYKLMVVVTDAMIDSCLVVYDDAAQCTVGFYTLLRSYQKLLASPCPRSMVMFVTSCISLLFVTIFNGGSLIQWDRRENDIFILFIVATFILAVLLVFDYWRSVNDPFGPAMTRWWRKAVPRSRRSYLYILALYCVYLSWVKGCSYGLASFCEGMVYISLLHAGLLLSGRVTFFFHRMYAIGDSVMQHPKGRWVLLGSAFPIVSLVMSSAAVSSATLVIVEVSLVCVVISAVAKRLGRAGRRDGGGTSEPSEKGATAAPPTSAWREGSRRGRPGVLLRAFHRLTFSSAVLLILSLALWVSVKHPGLEGVTPTRCTGVATGERIRVTARYMVADLYGLRDYEDPKKLVYELDEMKYDAARHVGLCSRRWAVDLHAADLAYFSLMAYLQRDSEDTATMLNFYRRYRDDASDWVVVPTNHTYGRAVFRHIYSPSKNTSVIAVRGTDITSPFDILQNMLLFSETFFFKMLANILPLSSLIPERVIVDYVAASSAISASLLGGPPKDYYHLHVEDYLRSVNSKHIVLTGHSLGGVVAHIVAARAHLPGVAFSSPGINLMRKKLGIDPDAIDGFTTNVIVSNDFTVDLDTPGGTVHHIQCEHKTAEVCHSIELHAIRMWTVCPSYRARTRLNGTYILTG
ncbi:hypothetical protein DQ04_01431060 [Trypanosoma grayi]|uniref:hypothetical protein n=1 Tax=Trypanosoma grayi TaxID=71804 RepID=UPI0004F4A943|nr:hypothetical protein DQ04_01431060 [Trypanosoma grayi]KEG12777.1 hypothetical protein DQ04_01431060 [Trypanosoma grayi]